VVALAVVAILVAGSALPGAGATVAGDIGYRDQSTLGATPAPSGSKPESKLWWNDGYWWADMWNPAVNDFHIYKLNLSTQTWLDTGVPLDTRSGSRADALWDGTHLYVASHQFALTPAAGFPSYLYRFSYDAASDRYTLDSGFPATINNYKTETLVIDKDSTGKLWATWTQGNTVWVNRTVGNAATWGTPFALPVNGASGLDPDDISSVISFGPGKIGVMWSNQVTSAMYFAIHVDGDPDTSWQASRTAIQGPNQADDHINLKSLQSDGSGRVFAAVKTSMTASAAPLNMLLARDPATGDWSSYVFGRVSDHHTRPIVMLDDEHRVIHMFATSGEAGGTIYEKTSPLDNISFAQGLGTPVIQDGLSADMNNVTSTKQNVNSTTGLVVLATNDTTHFYWHNYISLGGTPPPPVTADFSGSPTSGVAPLAVSFSDLSTGSPSSWAWDFDNNGTVDSTAQNPTYTYTSAGTYTVSLTAANGSSSDTKTKLAYVTVSAGGGGTASLPALHPNGDGTITSVKAWPGAVTTNLYTFIDENVSACDGGSSYAASAPAGSSGSYFVQVQDVPADFISMSSVNIDICLRTVGRVDDNFSLYGQWFKADETTALSNEVTIATNPFTSNFGTLNDVAFTGVVAGTKADWDGARLKLRWNRVCVGTCDSIDLKVSAFEVGGVYNN
jgi:PKD repeat protein